MKHQTSRLGYMILTASTTWTAIFAAMARFSTLDATETELFLVLSPFIAIGVAGVMVALWFIRKGL